MENMMLEKSWKAAEITSILQQRCAPFPQVSLYNKPVLVLFKYCSDPYCHEMATLFI